MSKAGQRKKAGRRAPSPGLLLLCHPRRGQCVPHQQSPHTVAPGPEEYCKSCSQTLRDKTEPICVKTKAEHQTEECVYVHVCSSEGVGCNKAACVFNSGHR